MKTLPLILVLGMLVLLIGVMVWVLIGGWRRHSRNRFRIMTAGVHARATVTRIEPADRSGATVVHFTLVPESGARAIAGRQPTTRAAVDALHLQAGSGLDVRFLAKHPHVLFFPTRWRAPSATTRKPVHAILRMSLSRSITCLITILPRISSPAAPTTWDGTARVN